MNPTRLLAIAAAITLAATTQLQAREFYELRTYQLKSEEKAKSFDQTLGPALVDAMDSAAIGPVGVFKPVEAKKDEKAQGEVLRYVLIPYKSIEDWANLSEALKENGAVWEPALEFLFAEKDDPNYSRIDSSLLVAFDGWPELKLPEKARDPADRHFEIRTYESHSTIKGTLKVEMFNLGEIDIFRAVGLDAVFYGEAKIAKNLPQLTYMLVYENKEAREKSWQAFKAHPDWLKLKSKDRYKDTVSKILSTFVKATDYSQIK